MKLTKLSKFSHLRLRKYTKGSTNRCIHNMSPFWVDFGLEASSSHSPSKTVLTVIGARYRDMINNFFLRKLQNMHVNQKDTVTCHVAQKIIGLLLE